MDFWYNGTPRKLYKNRFHASKSRQIVPYMWSGLGLSLVFFHSRMGKEKKITNQSQLYKDHGR